jgi:hypothetical protein
MVDSLSLMRVNMSTVHLDLLGTIHKSNISAVIYSFEIKHTVCIVQYLKRSLLQNDQIKR